MDQIRDTDFNLFASLPSLDGSLSLSLSPIRVNMLADPCLIPPVNLMPIFNWKWFDSRENILRFSLPPLLFLYSLWRIKNCSIRSV